MNAVVYARYSSHGQKEQSIEGQMRECYAYAKREGINIVGEYVDRAITGRSDDRPQFQRMINDSGKRLFEYVLVWKLDRFARNRYDSAIYKARLKKHGVKVVSASEMISDDPEGIILEGMLESMAEYYSANLAKHVKRGQRESVINGTFLGGKPPIGFKVVEKRLVVDDVKAPIIKYAFEQYAKGVPKRDIVDELNARGVRNFRGKPLTLSSMQSALRNEKYIGVYRYNGEPVAGGCEALIDEKTFYEVQKRLDAVRHAPAAKKAKVEYLLYGKLYCGHCGARMVGESGRGKLGNIYNYYACAAKKKAHTCDKRNEKKDFAEWYVVEQTVNYVLSSDRIGIIAAGVVASYEQCFGDSTLQALQQQIDALDREINKLVDTATDAPKAARARIFEKIENLDTQKIDAELNLASLEIANGTRYTEAQIVAWIKQFCKGDPFDPEYRKRVIEVFVNAVYIYDNKFAIYYNINGGEQVSYIEMLESLEEEPDSGVPVDTCGVRISNDTPRQIKATPCGVAFILWRGIRNELRFMPSNARR